ncbi:uncharacterized protein LY79DRAFT_673475 [Colletotrichum navitas]|uniref:Uncharacterized protein n=1 Tax=Colletotrichum navitas TaxID=681940 RepID=A0AAD8PP24_9PEZI|nr:uncharacterized protein LY79DRAFT_673475 [Colletotrichum navitas]KAK1573661.1 hypothetical protein LY79DRAFT_673475 [Colletotrichum navitas]
MDVDKEWAIQETIQDEFEGYMLIAASGRPEIIMDIDRVVVIDKGGVVDVGSKGAGGHGGYSTRRAVYVSPIKIWLPVLEAYFVPWNYRGADQGS